MYARNLCSNWFTNNDFYLEKMKQNCGKNRFMLELYCKLSTYASLVIRQDELPLITWLYCFFGTIFLRLHNRTVVGKNVGNNVREEKKI
jgi:hypothetical protein